MAKELQHKPVGDSLSSEEYHDPLSIGDTHNLGADQEIGDIIVADVDNAGRDILRGLAKGRAGTVLMSDGTRPTWDETVFNIQIKLADDQYLTFGSDNDARIRWNHGNAKVEITGINIGDLSNVRDTTPTNGQALIYDTVDSIWRPLTLHNVVLHPGGGHIATDDIDDEAVTSDKLADDAVTADKIAVDAVTTGAIRVQAVGTEELADNAVTTMKIADGAITNDKLGQGVGFTVNIDAGDLTGITRLLDEGIEIRPEIPQTGLVQGDWNYHYQFKDFEIGPVAETTNKIVAVNTIGGESSYTGIREYEYQDIFTRTTRMTAIPQPTNWGIRNDWYYPGQDDGSGAPFIGQRSRFWRFWDGLYHFDPFITNKRFGRDVGSTYSTAERGIYTTAGVVASGTNWFIKNIRRAPTSGDDYAYVSFALLNWQLSIYRIGNTLYGGLDSWLTQNLSVRAWGPVGNINQVADATIWTRGRAVVAGLAYGYLSDTDLGIDSVIGLGNLSRTDINTANSSNFFSINGNRLAIYTIDDVDAVTVSDDPIPATGGSVNRAPSVRATRSAITDVQADYLRERTEILSRTAVGITPSAVTLTEDLQAGTQLVFRIDHETGVNLGYDTAFVMPTDEILALSGRYSSAPSTSAGAGGDLDESIMVGDPAGSTNKLAVWRHTDGNKLWVRMAVTGTYYLSIYRYKLGLAPANTPSHLDAVADWAEDGNTSLIPAGKMANIVSNDALPAASGSETVAPSQKAVRDALVQEAQLAGTAVTDNSTADRAYARTLINNADIPANVSDASTTTATTQRAVRQAITSAFDVGDGAVSPTITLMDTRETPHSPAAVTLNHDLEPNQFIWIAGSTSSNTDTGQTELGFIPAAAILRLAQQSSTPNTNDPHVNIENYTGTLESVTIWRHSDANKLWIDGITTSGSEFNYITMYAVEIHSHAEEGGLGDATRAINNQSITGTSSGAATLATLSKDLAHGQLLTFCINPTASGYAGCHAQTVLSDDILRLTEQNSAPTNVANAYSFPYHESHDIYIWRSDDAGELYIRLDQDAAVDLFIYDVHAIIQSSTGLNQAEVDARVRDGVLDWAETGNTDTIDLDKIPALPISKISHTLSLQVSNWARTNNDDPIPADKLTNAPNNGLTQAQVDNRVADGVQDWAEATNTDVIPFGKLSSVLINDVRTGTNASTDVAPTEAAVRSELDDLTATINSGTIDTAAVNALIDTRVEDYALTTESVQIPDSEIQIVSNDDLDASVTGASTTKAPSERAVRQAIDAVELEYGEGLSGLGEPQILREQTLGIGSNSLSCVTGAGDAAHEVSLSGEILQRSLLLVKSTDNTFGAYGTISSDSLLALTAYSTAPTWQGSLNSPGAEYIVTAVRLYAGQIRSVYLMRHTDPLKLWVFVSRQSIDDGELVGSGNDGFELQQQQVRFGGGDAKLGNAIGVLNKVTISDADTITNPLDANLAGRWRLATLDAPIPTDHPHILSVLAYEDDGDECFPTTILSSEFLARAAVGHDADANVYPTNATLQSVSFQVAGSHDHDHTIRIASHTDPNKLWIGGEGGANVFEDDLEINAYPVEGGSILVHDDTLTSSQRSTTVAPSQRAVYDHVEAVKGSSLLHKDEFFHHTSTHPASDVHGSATITPSNPLFDYNVNHYKQVGIWWQWSDYMGYALMPLEAIDTQEDTNVDGSHWGRIYVRSDRDTGKWISFHKNSSGKLVWDSYRDLTNSHWLHIKAWGYR